MTRLLPRSRDVGLVIALFSLLLLIIAKLDPQPEDALAGPFYVVDGDTLARGGERLRLVGLDAPELDQTCEDGHGAPWPCGVEARRRLMRLAAGSGVECRGNARDRYQRRLVTCYSGANSINAALVREGLAVALGDYRDEQSQARLEGLGIWQGKFEAPRDWRNSRGLTEEPGFLRLLVERLKAMVAR